MEAPEVVKARILARLAALRAGRPFGGESADTPETRVGTGEATPPTTVRDFRLAALDRTDVGADVGEHTEGPQTPSPETAPISPAPCQQVWGAAGRADIYAIPASKPIYTICYRSSDGSRSSPVSDRADTLERAERTARTRLASLGSI